MEQIVTFRHVVFALPVVVVALAAAGGFILTLAKANAAPLAEQLAELKADVRTKDAGVREQLILMESRSIARSDTTDRKLDSLISRMLDGGARAAKK